jgi:WD40 repeat protein
MTESTAKWPIFICYRQSDGKSTAERLYSLLNGLSIPTPPPAVTLKHPPVLDVYFDQAAPGIGDWTEIHEPYLKRARAFIVVCSPGARIDEGDRDWVHREINWWLEHRGTAPILIDPLGEGERYIPKAIADKWPNAQRIRMVQTEWDRLKGAELRSLQQRTQAQIVGGITFSGETVYREELEREQERTKKLQEALKAQVTLSMWLRRSVLTVSVLSVLALGIAGIAEWQRRIAEDRRITSLSRQLAATSQLMAESNFRLETAALLAVEGLKRRPSPELEVTARSLLSAMPKAINAFSKSSAFAASPDGNLFATLEVSTDKLIIALRDLPNCNLRARMELPSPTFSSVSLAFGPTANTLVIKGSKDAWIWDWTKPNRPLLLSDLGQRDIVLSKTGRWLAGLGTGGVHVYDLSGEYAHRVLPAGDAPWMHAAVFSLSDDNILLLARHDEPGYISFVDVTDGSVQRKFFATRLTKQPKVLPNTPIDKVFNSDSVDEGVGIRRLLISLDGRTVAVIEGRFIVMRDDDWRVHLWDISDTPRRINTIVRATESQWAMSGDGKFLAGGDEGGDVSVYALPNGDLLASRSFRGRVDGIALSEEGGMIASSHRGNTAFVWSWRSNEIMGRPAAPTELGDIAVMGKYLFGLTRQKQLFVWEMPTGVNPDLVSFRGTVQRVVTAPAGDMALAWTNSNETLRWRPSSGDVARWTNRSPDAAQFSDDGRYLAVLDGPWAYVFLDGSAKLTIALPSNYEEMRGKDGVVSRWIKADLSETTINETHFTENVPDFVITDNHNEYLRSVAREVYWSRTRPQDWKQSEWDGTIGHQMAISRDGKEVAVTSLDWVFRYDVESGKKVGIKALGYETTRRFAFPSDRTSQVNVHIERLIYDAEGILWIFTREEGLWYWLGDEIRSVGRRRIVAMNDHVFAASLGSNDLDLYEHGLPPQKITGIDDRVVALSPDGKYLATTKELVARTVEILGGHNAGTLTLSVIDTRTGSQKWSARHIGGAPSIVKFSPDGSLLALGDQEGAVRAWSVKDGRELVRASAHNGISHLSFTYDAKAILFISEDQPRILRVARIGNDELIKGLCSRVTRDLTLIEWEQYLDERIRKPACFEKPIEDNSILQKDSAADVTYILRPN